MTSVRIQVETPDTSLEVYVEDDDTRKLEGLATFSLDALLSTATGRVRAAYNLTPGAPDPGEHTLHQGD